MLLRRVSLVSLLVLFGCPSKTETPAPADPNAISVVALSPTGAATTQPIEVRFSQAMVAEDRLGQEVSAAEFLAIEPAVPGKAEWASREVLVFSPTEPFPKNHRFKVTVLPGVAPAGKRLEGPLEYSFHTELMQVVRVEPFFTGRGNVETRVNIELNYPVKPEDAAKAIQFSDGSGKSIPATLETKESGSMMAFRLAQIPAGDAPTIKVGVDGALTPIFGGEPLGQTVVRDFVLTRPNALVVDQIYPQQEGDQFTIYVRFGDEVDPETAGASVSVEPKVKYSTSQSWRGLQLRGPFKPGKSYNVTIKKGLVGRSGGMLSEDVTRAVVIADLEPQLRFASDGSYLMKLGRQKVALETVNVKKARVTIDKVFENNMVHVLPRLRTPSRSCFDDGCYGGEGYEYEYGYDGEYGYQSYYQLGTFGTTVHAGMLDIKDEKNVWVTTAVSFEDIHREQRTGLYRLRITDEERSWTYVEKWLLATDLALTVKVGLEEARAQVLSLSTLKPVSGVEVRFVSQTNQPLGKATTDGNGIAVQSLKGLKPGEPLALVTAHKGEDFSYLALAGTAVPTADFDVGGEGDTAAPYEAYLYTERGVYRPGDTAHLVVLMRDKSLKTPPAFPYTVEIRDPQWRIFQTLKGSTDRDGGRAFDIAFAADALTGSYSVRILGATEGTVLGWSTIKVEEFMPDRIKVEVKAETKVLEAGESAQFGVQSNYLFGPPAKGLRLESNCELAEVGVETATWGSFSFAQGGTEGFVSYTEELGESNLDDEGKSSLSCGHNGEKPLRRPLRITMFATVSEAGGRAVTGASSALLHAHPHYVGVRRNAKAYYAEVGKPAALEALVIDREGKPKAGVALTAELAEIQWKSVLKLDGGRYRYVSERSEKHLQNLELKSTGGPVPVPFTPERPGSYRLRVTAAPTGAWSEIEFWASGGGWAPWEMNKPDQIGLSLDKEVYAPGETAKVMVRAPFDGELYVTIERDRVLHHVQATISGNSGSVSVPITQDMTPNAYVVAQLVRSRTSAEKMAPMRAFGVLPLKVSAERHKLAVSLAAPETMRPRQALEVEIEVKGAQGTVQATLAAVDEGILRITNFASPDPFAFYTRKRRLSLTTHDLFELVMPEVDLPGTAIATAGGGDVARAKHLNPVSVKRVKPVALWSGVVTLDGSGKGKIKLDVPQFQGSLRVMAVAFSGERFGAASKNVTVRDPIVLTPTLPRFLGPLDRFKVPVEVFNGTGKAGAIEVKLEIAGRLQAIGEKAKTIQLAANEQGVVEFEIQTDEVAGQAKVTLRAAGNGADTFSETDLPIRPASTTITEGAALTAVPGRPVRYKVPSGFMPGTMKVRVTVGGAPAAQFGAALQYLIQYPYGCVEQTTSRAFPLIYLRDLAKHTVPELAQDQSVAQYVDAGIERVTAMLSPSGGLSYWPGSSWGYPWATVYGAHFLVEAKKAGYTVDPKALDRLLDHLEMLTQLGAIPFYSSSAPDFRSQAYALYVLAVAGRPNASATLWAADRLTRAIKGERLLGHVPTDEETRALIGGALLLAGNRARAQDFIGLEMQLAKPGPQTGFWSPTRAEALMLAVLADVKPDHPSVPLLMKSLIDHSRIGRWYNTQENAYALLGLGKIGRALGEQDFKGTIKVGGKEVKTFHHREPSGASHSGMEWVGQEIEVAIEGKGTAFVGIEVEGIRAGLLEPKSKGIKIERRFLTKEGQPIDPQKIKQGQLVVARIELTTSAGSAIENVAIVDLLPAGLEIENPRLSNEAVEPWMNDRRHPQYIDIRDDRILMFGHVWPGQKEVYYYTARAVTVGDFVLPHVHAEAMYDPATQAYASGGKAAVLAR